MRRVFSILLPLALLAGCANYKWTSSVPEDLRTVSVPTFGNESDIPGAGTAVAREILREVQREGTFGVRSSDDAAVEVQGTLEASSTAADFTGRLNHVRLREDELTLSARVSFVDRKNGRVLVDGRTYSSTVTYVVGSDRATPKSGAVERAAGDLARQIVDDLVNLNWKKGAKE